MKPIYLVAKYVRDVLRMEPVNFGIILWDAGRFAMKFYGTTIKDKEVTCDARSLKWVGSPDSYGQWIEYWVNKINHLSADLPEDEVIDILTKTNEKAGNYWLVNGGFLLDEAEDLDAAVGQLYQMLVDKIKYNATAEQHQQEKDAFDRKCKELLSESGLMQIDGFKTNEEILCDLFKDVRVTIKFPYSIHNGTLRSVIEKIPTSSKESHLERNIHDAAFKMERILSSKYIKKDNALLFFENKSAYSESSKGKEFLDIMNYSGNPIDILEKNLALEELARIKEEILKHS